MQVNEVVVNGVTELSLVNDTVSETSLLEGETAHAANGEAIVGKAKYINPNLLDNPDFSINQRGQTEYSGSPGYCVDRWYRNTVATVTPLEGGGVSISYSSETNASIYQKVENAQKLCGKVVTVSASVNGTIHSISGTLPNDLSTNQTYALFVRLDGSTDVPTNSTPHLRIQVYNGGLLFVINYIAKVERVKLELGKVSTIDNDPPPNPATELAKCQRYLTSLMQSSVYRAVAIGTDYIDFSIPTPTTMRPISGMSIISPENFVVRSINPTADQAGFTFSVVTYGTNQLRLRALKAAHGLTDATLAVTSSNTVFLSAEL